jgi:hypothetical protein
MSNDEGLRRSRAERLRRKIDDMLRGARPRRPMTPREFTDAAAHEAAEVARREAVTASEDEPPDNESPERVRNI